MGGSIEKLVLFAAVGGLLYIALSMFDVHPGGAGSGTHRLQGQIAPDFELPALRSERTWRLRDLRGKVVLVSFWATWCGPCQAELPGLEDLHDELADKGLVVLAVNRQENRETVARYINGNRFDMPVALDTTGAAGSAYGVRGIPALFIIGPDGVVSYAQTGYRRGQEADIRKRIEALLPAHVSPVAGSVPTGA